jgi:hypothetical protein
MPDPSKHTLALLTACVLLGCGASSDGNSRGTKARPAPDAGSTLDAAPTAGPSPTSDAAPSADAAQASTAPPIMPPPSTPPDGASPPAFCQHPGDDAVRDLFCGDAPPRITSLADLHTRLKVVTSQGGSQALAAAILGHSTSLKGHLVSPINPRAIVSGDQQDLLLAFQRGVQQVEIAARRNRSALTFYLLTFRQACNDAPGGCRPGDLYTPTVESGWTSVVAEDDEALKNTPSDCRQCHERGTKTLTLLMRERDAPWTHFFAPEGDPAAPLYRYGISGGLLTTQFRAARGDETYANLTSASIQNAFGFALEAAVPGTQPLIFDAPGILSEHFPSSDGVPSAPQRSAIWDREFDAFKRGEHLALPYFDALTTDPTKLATLSKAYRDYQDGTLAAADLPDLADVFPDDPQTRAEIGLETEPNATPVQALVQACGPCHNDVLDQTLSRARFSVDVTRLTRPEIEQALKRLQLDEDAPSAMPPADARRLTPPVRARLVEYLQQGEFSDADRSFLEHAATVGMAGVAEIQKE